MNKRIISILCVLTMLLSAASILSLGVSASSGVSIVCSVTEQTETDVTVDVSVTSNVGFGFLELTPSFSDALTFSGVTNGSLISDFTQGNQYIWTGDDDVTATGTLCTLKFTIPEGTANGEYPISFVVRLCGNYNEEEVDVNVTPCNVTIGGVEDLGVDIVCSVTEQTETDVTVDVSVTSNAGFGFLELTPSFPTALTLTGVTNGTLISDFTQGNQYIWTGDNDITTTGTLCTLKFVIPEGTANGEYPISFVVRFCGNYDEEEVEVNVSPCTVTVSTTPTPEEPKPEDPKPEMPTADASVVSYQVTKGEDGKFSLRVISGLNSLEYSHYGYEITVTTKDESGNDIVQTLSGKDYKVYSSIYGGMTAYSIKDNFGYEYAGLATVTGLATDSTYTKIELRSYATAKDGTATYGTGCTLLYTGETNEGGFPTLSFEVE